MSVSSEELSLALGSALLHLEEVVVFQEVQDYRRGKVRGRLPARLSSKGIHSTSWGAHKHVGSLFVVHWVEEGHACFLHEGLLQEGDAVALDLLSALRGLGEGAVAGLHLVQLRVVEEVHLHLRLRRALVAALSSALSGEAKRRVFLSLVDLTLSCTLIRIGSDQLDLLHVVDQLLWNLRGRAVLVAHGLGSGSELRLLRHEVGLRLVDG